MFNVKKQRLRSESIGRLSVRHRKEKPAPIKAHPRLWSVVMFHGDGKGLECSVLDEPAYPHLKEN